jgi:hypothetical protein
MPRVSRTAAALALAAALAPAPSHAQRSLAHVDGLDFDPSFSPSRGCASILADAWQDGARTGWLDCLPTDPPLDAISGGLWYDVLASGSPAAVRYTSYHYLTNYAGTFYQGGAQVGYGDVVWWDDPRIATMEVLPTLSGSFTESWDPSNTIDRSRLTLTHFASVGFAGSPYPTQPGIPSNDFSCTTTGGVFPVWSETVASGTGDLAVDWTLDRDTPISCRSNTTDAAGRRGLAFKYYSTTTSRITYDDPELDPSGAPVGFSMTLTGDFAQTSFLALRFRDARGQLIGDPQYSTLSGTTYVAAPPGAGPSVVPEPASLGLTATGVGLLALAAYRRRVEQR